MRNITAPQTYHFIQIWKLNMYQKLNQKKHRDK